MVEGNIHPPTFLRKGLPVSLKEYVDAHTYVVHDSEHGYHKANLAAPMKAAKYFRESLETLAVD